MLGVTIDPLPSVDCEIPGDRIVLTFACHCSHSVVTSVRYKIALVQAALTEYHKRDGSYRTNIYFSLSGDWEVQGLGASRFSAW